MQQQNMDETDNMEDMPGLEDAEDFVAEFCGLLVTNEVERISALHMAQGHTSQRTWQRQSAVGKPACPLLLPNHEPAKGIYGREQDALRPGPRARFAAAFKAAAAKGSAAAAAARPIGALADKPLKGMQRPMRHGMVPLVRHDFQAEEAAGHWGAAAPAAADAAATYTAAEYAERMARYIIRNAIAEVQTARKLLMQRVPTQLNSFGALITAKEVPPGDTIATVTVRVNLLGDRSNNSRSAAGFLNSSKVTDGTYVLMSEQQVRSFAAPAPAAAAGSSAAAGRPQLALPKVVPAVVAHVEPLSLPLNFTHQLTLILCVGTPASNFVGQNHPCYITPVLQLTTVVRELQALFDLAQPQIGARDVTKIVLDPRGYVQQQAANAQAAGSNSTSSSSSSSSSDDDDDNDNRDSTDGSTSSSSSRSSRRSSSNTSNSSDDESSGAHSSSSSSASDVSIDDTAFDSLPEVVKSGQINSLDHYQLRFVQAACSNKSVVQLRGPAGTGKTTTIVGVLEAEKALGKRVCVGTASNDAAAEIVRKMTARGICDPATGSYSMQGVNLVVVAGNIRDPAVQPYLLDARVTEKLLQDKGYNRERIEEEVLQQDQDIVALRNRVAWHQLKGQRSEARQKQQELAAAEQTAIDDLLRAQYPGRNELEPARRMARIQLLSEAHFVIGTLGSLGGYVLEECRPGGRIPPFDVVLIDEASQAAQPDTAVACRLVANHGKLRLVGDPAQLPPVVKSRLEEVVAELPITLMDRFIAAGCPTYMLRIQYRMNPAIAAFPNRAFYKRKLKDGVTDEQRRAPHHHQRDYGPLLFFNVDGQETQAVSGSYSNKPEARAVVKHFARLYNHAKATGINLGTVGFTSPYKEQVALLKHELCTELNFADEAALQEAGLRVGTVDGFQGQEADIILYSAVRANHTGAVGFTGDKRRLNVALTRAKRSLWVFGSVKTLRNHGQWRRFIRHARRKGCLRQVHVADNAAPGAAARAGADQQRPHEQHMRRK